MIRTRRVASSISVVGFVLTGCSGVTAEAPPTSDVETVAPTVGVAAGEPDDQRGSAVTATTDVVTSTTLDVADDVPATTAVTTPLPGALPGEVRGEEEEPSFDLGPDIALDVDVARFPVDDAGQGGTEVTVVDDAGVATVQVAGWAGFDRSLGDALIRPGNTAASVAVSIDGEIVHRAAFGLRDPSTADPTDTDDRFRIASISKPITAVVVLQLVEDGVVGLDDPIGRTIADHVDAGSVSASTASLTLRQLLTHRSGFGKYQSTFFRGGAADCPGAAREGLASGAGGGGYVYSNMNYCLVGLAIEALTGLTYEQATYRYFLTPLGISGMRLAPTFDPGPGEVQHVSTPERNYMETLGAAGAWIASPSDLVTIIDSLDADSPGFAPLELPTVLTMATPAGGQFGQRGYGLGLISYGNGRFGHTGTIESTHAMVLDRGDGVTWAVTVAGQYPGESTDLERIINAAFVAGGFVSG